MRKVQDKLFMLQDSDYGNFLARLVPDMDKDKIIGVRTPILRKYAREFSKDPECLKFLEELPHQYYEENNLHGYLIESITKDFDQALEMTEEFLPYIDNWATCDTFAPKVFKKNMDKLYDKTIEWMKSNHTYTVRYGIVTNLRYFLDEAFREEMLQIIAELHRDEYYIKMAAAWYYSVALIKQYEKTIPLFENSTLDKWIHNKSLQKAVESYRIDKETKAYLRSLKIK